MPSDYERLAGGSGQGNERVALTNMPVVFKRVDRVALIGTQLKHRDHRAALRCHGAEPAGPALAAAATAAGAGFGAGVVGAAESFDSSGIMRDTLFLSS